MTRLFRTIFLAAFEATVVGLPFLALTTIALSWPGLFSAVVLGRVADEVGGRLRWPFNRSLLVLAPIVAAAWLSWLTFGLNPLILLAVLPLGQPQSGPLYLAVLVAFFLVWRGVRLADHDSATILTLAGRGVIGAVLALILGPLLRTGEAVSNDLLLVYIVVFVGSGLAALALTHVVEMTSDQAQSLDARWSLLLLGVIGAVLALGISLAALLSGDLALEGMIALLQLLLLPFALIGAALVYLITVVFGDVIRALLGVLGRVLAQMNLRPEPPPTPDTAVVDDTTAETVVAIAQQATFLLALIPLVALVIIIVLWRRRHRRSVTDEERQSLDIGQSLIADLRDLFGSFRRPFRRHLHGLQAALAALRGADAVSRVRRAYIQALLALEAQGWRRPPDQTPSEWCTHVSSVLPDQQPFIDLTATYERARYRPDGVDADEADAAERSLQGLRTSLSSQRSQ